MLNSRHRPLLMQCHDPVAHRYERREAKCGSRTSTPATIIGPSNHVPDAGGDRLKADQNALSKGMVLPAIQAISSGDSTRS
jgi:hypothetical protein